ncbi:flagellar hook assembly protein FlgD [Pseudoroseomonas sp. WGS1072]|uniref:flagellar hook assembly protein FlgD n=1 Tax=Roseomonas sp. WGS1072 TaxID=3366816 RepID=UPI000DB0CDBA|nr:MAG: flagellar biosynthesis protein FlgD [Pseudoxanthomonas suwonensis]
MATSSTSAITAATAGGAATAPTASLSSSSADFDRFLTLLTAQMKFQDPMQPTDPTQFVAQLAQFSQVEQQTKTNTLLTGIASALSNGGTLAENAALLGKTVQSTLSQITVPDSGTSTVTATVTAGTLGNTRLEVLDAGGAVVRRIGLAQGENTVVFDGKSADGTRLATGRYNVRVVGDDAGGARQSAGSVSAGGTITEFRKDSTGAFTLVLSNGSVINAADVTQIRS